MHHVYEVVMTSLVSIRVNDKLLQAMKANAHRLHLSQTDYIRKAIERMNSETERQERKKRLKNASLRVRKESMKVNAEFTEIEHDPEA
jgi:Arc/MetJ-type ribon-helix-helix transcriptional regulator